MDSRTNLKERKGSLQSISSKRSKDGTLPMSLTSQESVLVPTQSEGKKRSKKIWRDESEQSSHTKFMKKPRRLAEFESVTRDGYLSISESMSGSSDTFSCIHGSEGKQYSPKGLLKRNIVKNLDPIPFDRKWTEKCDPTFGWDMALILQTMVESGTVEHQLDRFIAHLRDFAKTSSKGYRVDVLNSYCIVVNYLLESVHHLPVLNEELVLLLKNLQKPILLINSSDIVSYFDEIMHFMGFIAYLLIRVDQHDHFDFVSNAMLFHLSAPDSVRGPGTVHQRHTLVAAAPVLRVTIVRMVAVANNHRFPTFLDLVLLLACDTEENCIEMMKENIIEIIFYRFNPYFPKKDLPHYEINPRDCLDATVKLGESSKNMTTTLSLLLVLLKTTMKYLEKNPGFRKLLPAPDCYAQRCFIWAYRYECRARAHHHQRITLTVVAALMNKCYGDRLLLFSSILMPDVMSLSVLTELPPRNDWISTVNFSTSQQDVQFKKTLIHFVVDLLKVFPYNKFMMESRGWLLGIMYLLDPGLCSLRLRWSPALFGELRKTALQALVCTLPLSDPTLVTQYGLIRRIMWYIEWYTESPYEIPVLYWCVRLLQVATYHRNSSERGRVLRDLFDTHGVIIIMNLCYALMEQKTPPVEKSQAVIALSLRILTSSLVQQQRVCCVVYPSIMWPITVNWLARKMLDVVIYSLDKHYIVSDRWKISLLNFVWEAIVWNETYREQFVADNGIYKLLDMITMTRPPVQCLALALVCDIARAGEAVGQLVTWRAHLGATNANPKVVNRGATIATLLATVFREGCRSSGVRLSPNGVLQDLDLPIMSQDAREELYNTDSKSSLGHRTPTCLAAADLAGSSMSKAYALLHMLSEDLQYKVSLADETYNLYKNIQLATEDEVSLVLCSHYLTLKLNEVWRETQVKNVPLIEKDNEILEDFINVGKGWAKVVQHQQEEVIAVDRRKQREEESSLYAFLGRIRLNIALDALRSVRCVARSTDHNRITHTLLHDAVFAHHRRTIFADKNNATLLRTYKPPLDDENITGQNVKVSSIQSTTVEEPYISEKDDRETGCDCGCAELKVDIKYAFASRTIKRPSDDF
ncbi:hypothetical protein PYW08_000213 [Mythimna loreyi]|uniref:Uncharacterized protein n=1 Tax=Mythimna loreyi TaxID=667449 RepID=A0ACC2RAN8_9NEOP|nr:hypothetical protein PYW08_000213 [Mythimna loreyi]